jgi:hypothetical protein
MMSKLEFKAFSCIFCTIGYNCYVAGHKLVVGGYEKLTKTDEQKNAVSLTVKEPTK